MCDNIHYIFIVSIMNPLEIKNMYVITDIYGILTIWSGGENTLKMHSFNNLIYIYRVSEYISTICMASALGDVDIIQVSTK